MKFQCIFCQQDSQHIRVKEQYHFRCNTCTVWFQLNEDKHLKLITFLLYQEPKTYTLHLHVIDNRTQLTYNEPYPEKFCFGGAEPDIYAELLNFQPMIKNVTPQNLKDKISFLLTYL